MFIIMDGHINYKQEQDYIYKVEKPRNYYGTITFTQWPLQQQNNYSTINSHDCVYKIEKLQNHYRIKM